MTPVEEPPSAPCVIIGAGLGLGSAVARRFAAAGHPVGIIGRQPAALRGVLDALSATGHRATSAVADAADPASLSAALDRLRAELGPVGVLVYNAASYTAGMPSELPPERLTSDYAVNVTGALHAVQHLLPDLIRSQGTVLLTGGGAAIYPSPECASLSLTKSGLRLLAQLLHAKLTPRVHITTVTIQGQIGSRPRFAPDTIAQTYLDLQQQPVEQWTADTDYTD